MMVVKMMWRGVMRMIGIGLIWITPISIISMGALLGCGGGAHHADTARRELAPANPEAVRTFVDGVHAMQRGGDDRAVASFNAALRIDANLWEAHYNLGVIHRRRNELSQAAEELQAARTIQPAAREPLLALAEVEHARGHNDQAINLLRAFRDQQPTSVEVRVALATLLREAQHYDEALAEAREALVRDPGNARALAEVGRIYRAKGQYDVAELVFKKALAVAPSADLHNDLGLLALARGDTQAAFDEFAQALTLDAHNAAARLNQGSVLLHAGDYDGAVEQFRAVVREDSGNVDAHIGLGIALRGKGDHQGARQEYERALVLSPNHPEGLFDLAILKAEFLDQRPDARTFFQRFLDTGAATASQREVAERYLREIPAPQSAAPPRAHR